MPLLPILIGYLLGSIPFGYVIVKASRGIDIRDYGSHNIGATNVLRVVGWFPALLTLLGDLGKGVVPPILAVQPVFAGPEPNHWLVVLAPLAAIAGHAYSAYFYLLERKFARGKAVAAGAGAVVGLVAAGVVSWVALAVVVGVWAGAIILPRLLQGRWGWVSLASILAATAMPIAFGLTGARLPYVLFGLAAAAFVIWKHKENLGRLMDGVEPRLGEKLPLARIDQDTVAAAFLIHAVTPEDWWQTRRFAWARPLWRAGILPTALLKRLLPTFKAMKSDTYRGIRTADGRDVIVHLLVSPLLPEQIKGNPDLALRRAVQAAQMARGLGARCLGLGAYWSVVGNKGLDVQAQVDLPITNGGAYTAGTVKQAVPMMVAKLRARGIEPQEAVAAVVGANGVVGFGISRQLAGLVRRLVLVGTDAARLEKSAAVLRKRHPTTEIGVTTDVGACREADMVFTATSNVAPVVFPEHLKAGAVVYDLGRPFDVAPSVLAMPGVEVIPGGVVRPPGRMEWRIDTHFGPGLIPACMAETLLIAIDECYDRVSLGEGTRSENIDYFVALADRLGFEVVDEPLRPPGAPAARPASLPDPAPTAPV
jgi:acyl-phosphate glycerol 3-phosphate acyltransferase